MSGYQIDNSWTALLQPARSASFFRDAPPPPAAPTPAFDLGTAWWLAEMSRLVYVHEDANARGAACRPGTRRRRLRAVGGDQIHFFSVGGTEAAIVRLPLADARPMPPIHVLVFRGSHDLRDWLSNIDVRPAEWSGGGRVHRGFVEALDRIWTPLSSALDDVIRIGGPILYSGHSLGGALATLAAARRKPASLYTFGAPRVGDAAFASALRAVPHYRVVNDRDLVPWVPMPGPRVRFRHAGRLCRLTRDGGVQHSYWMAGRDALMQVRDYLAAFTDRRPGDAPPALADHALINYLARLDHLRRATGT